MRWVDNKKYVGKDRRKTKPLLRFGERRQADDTREPPTTAAMLRQMRVRAVAANSPEGVRIFCERGRVLADFAASVGEDYVASELANLIARVEQEPDADWSDALDRELSWLAERIGA
ncbi:MAG: hypothetical protein R3C25_02370 [Hyphomonadaceae bacterium]